ncbi:MAG: hypothetical protein V1897_16565 [Pseudomonadota bacterium]
MNLPTRPLGAAQVAASVQQPGHTRQLLDLIQAGETTASTRRAAAAFHHDPKGVSFRKIDSQKMTLDIVEGFNHARR